MATPYDVYCDRQNALMSGRLLSDLFAKRHSALKQEHCSSRLLSGTSVWISSSLPLVANSSRNEDAGNRYRGLSASRDPRISSLNEKHNNCLSEPALHYLRGSHR